jgi:16S rRNA (guanine1516-N2)-methyltransferase
MLKPSEPTKLHFWLRDASRSKDAEKWSTQFGCAPALADPGAEYRVLILGADGLSLRGPVQGGIATLRMVYHEGAIWRRLKQVQQGDSLLRRALRGKGKMPHKVLDGTAGLCRDALSIAMMGCHVEAFERAPLVVALVRDGLERAREGASFQKQLSDRLTLHQADFETEVPGPNVGAGPPDAVYLDPMFPLSNKSAQVKKEMALLHPFLRPPDDGTSLVEAALKTGAKRVLVKRSKRAKPLCPGVAHQFLGKSIRFDLYVPAISI